jgi:NhaP-type Na+/H+ or K+/H+ antiporter
MFIVGMRGGPSAAGALIAKLLNLEPYSTMIATMAGIALLMSFFIAAMAAYWILTSLD